MFQAPAKVLKYSFSFKTLKKVLWDRHYPHLTPQTRISEISNLSKITQLSCGELEYKPLGVWFKTQALGCLSAVTCRELDLPHVLLAFEHNFCNSVRPLGWALGALLADTETYRYALVNVLLSFAYSGIVYERQVRPDYIFFYLLGKNFVF